MTPPFPFESRGRQNCGGKEDNLLVVFKFLDGMKEETPKERKRNKNPKVAQGYCSRELGGQKGRAATVWAPATCLISLSERL